MLHQQIRTNVSQLGWASAATYLLARLVARVSRGRVRLLCYRLVAQRVPASAAAHCRPGQSNRVRTVDATDPVVAQFPRPPEVTARRFAGFIWLARSHYEEDEVRCRYVLAQPDDCAWDYDVYVDPSLRMGRTFARLWDAANAHLAERSIRWTLSRISAFNPGSLAAHGRLDIHHIGTALFLTFNRLQLSLFSQSPFIHLSVRAGSRPTLRLHPPPVP